MIVAGKSLGSKRPLFADWSAPIPPAAGSGDSGLTLRELIAHIVTLEVEAFRSRQEAGRLDRVLSPRQIEQGEARGRISPEGRNTASGVDTDEAIAAAHVAFEDGLYLVIIDEAEHRDLDAQVFVTPDSRITFIRLVFLAGA